MTSESALRQHNQQTVRDFLRLLAEQKIMFSSRYQKTVLIPVGLLIALLIHPLNLIAATPPSTSTQFAQAQSQTVSDEATIRQKLQRWRELFSQERYSLSGYEDLYVNTDELLVYDSYAPAGHEREIRGWNNYKTLWEQYIPIDFPGWKIIALEITRLEVHGDSAWSTISYVGRGVRDGVEYFGGQHGTHIWKRSNGDWRIVHEHLTTMTDQEVQVRQQGNKSQSFLKE